MSDRPPLPDQVGPYRLGEIIGEGGMGVVARGEAADGTVAAVKLLHWMPMRRPSEAARFERESRIRVDSPNVVRVLSAGVEQGLPWIAFELLEGETLAQRIERGLLTPDEAIDVGIQAARGLEAAHAASVIHRDLKPSNLFLCADGTVKIIDFGVARLNDDSTQLTGTGHVLGTPTYLSPEQASGARGVDHRTDLWALGVSLYEALTGRSPFLRTTALATVLAVMVEAPGSVLQLAPSVPPALDEAIGRCLEKKPSDRWRDARALREVLEAIEAGGGEAAMPPSLTATSPAMPPLVTPSIAPGEQRVVAVLLAQGLCDAGSLRGSIEGAGGAWLPVAGDRAIGLFGGEAWEGDEVERAAGAALEARGAAEHLAVASGRAAYSGATGIAGTALSAAEAGIAAGLEGVALDAQAARSLSDRYTMHRVDDTLFEIVDRVSAVSSIAAPPPSSTTTVGREAELAQLLRAIDTVDEEGRAMAVVVTGPPGAGKSHLRWVLGRVLEERGGFRTLAARPEPGERREAFSVFRGVMVGMLVHGAERLGWPPVGREAPDDERLRAVRALVAEAMGEGDDADDVVGLFAELLGVPAPVTPALEAARRDPMLMRDRLRIAIEDWLGALGERGPVALVLEDLQWADDASLDLVEELVMHPMEVPLLLFATARPQIAERRPGLVAPGHVLHVQPRPLSKSEVGRLAAAILGRELSARAVEALAERTAGNPLFVEQIVLALGEDGDVDEDLADVELPLDVEAAVQSRLDHLPAGEKELCKRAAVFGRPFAMEELVALGVGDPRPLLSSLMRRDLVAGQRSGSGREYRFRSTLVRDVAYGMLADGLRVELHHRAASMLAERAEPDLEETAMHFDRAGEGQRAALWYARAAEAASRRGDAPSVLRCADRALELGAPPEARYTLYVGRVEALESTGRLEEEDAALDQALAAAGDDLQRARVLTERAVWLARHGRSEQAIVTVAEAARAARAAGDPGTLAVARGKQSTILAFAGRIAEAEEACEEAATLARDRVPRLEPQAAGWRAQLASARGELSERREAYARAVALYQDAGDLRRAAGADMNLADVYNRFGSYAEAERALRTALEGCRRLGIRLMEGYALANLGYALTMLDRPDEALAVLSDARSIAEATGEKRLELSVCIYRARALSRSGDAEAAAGEVHRTTERARAMGDANLEAMASAVHAAALLEKGDVAGAVEASRRAMAIRDERGSLEEDEAELFVVAARALDAAGDGAAAKQMRARGRERVDEIASAIVDPELRARFLEDVPAHRALLSPPRG